MKKTLLFLIFSCLFSCSVQAQCDIILPYPDLAALGCVGTSMTLTDAAGAGTWSSSSATVASIGSSSGIITYNSAGTVTISYSGSGCSSSTTITVVAPSTDLILSSNSPVCSGSTLSLTDLFSAGATTPDRVEKFYFIGPGGYYVEGGWPGYTTTVVETIPSVSSTAAGQYVSYIRDFPYACAISNVAIDIMPSAPPSITGTTTICHGTSTTLADVVTGGSWSSSNISVATINTSTGVMTGVAAGSATITYTISNTCGSAITTTSVTINATPAAGAISGSSSVCAGSGITLTESVPGGIWSSTNATLATVSSTGVATGVAAGSDTILYGVTNSCGTQYARWAVTVNPLPNAGTITGNMVVPLPTAATVVTTQSITGMASVCTTGPTLTLSDAISGGAWSSSNTSRATVGSATGIVTAVSGGGTSGSAVTITYTVTNGCGTAHATYSITSYSYTLIPAAISGPAYVCNGTPSTYTESTTGPVQYWWCGTWGAITSTSCTDGIVATSYTTTGVLTETAVGTGTTDISVRYSVVDAHGCQAYATKGVGADDVPTVAPITGVSTLHYPGASVSFTDATGGGSWHSFNPTGANVSYGGLVVPHHAPDTATIAYSVSNVCGTTTVTYFVTVICPTCRTIGTADVTSVGQGAVEMMDVFPNPSRGLVTISIPSGPGEVRISVIDLAGKQVMSKVSTDNKTVIDLTGYPTGTYLLNVDADGEKTVKKILIE